MDYKAVLEEQIERLSKVQEDLLETAKKQKTMQITPDICEISEKIVNLIVQARKL